MFGRNCIYTDQELEDRVTGLMEQMTLKEKVWLLNGNYDMWNNFIFHGNGYNPTPIRTNGCERLGVAPVAFTDGPRGVVMGHATCFPVSMARGASFDTELERRIGNVIGTEARALGANYFAGVCINVLMNPAWGRAQETYSEDPFLLGEMGKALTESVQSRNVMVCLKHFALNNIENSRFTVDVDCSERTLHEVYLPHFKKCVDAGAASLMGSYNLFRGDQACESRYLLTEILRDKWGFKGFTSSDFIFGIRNGAKAIEAGMDVEMPLPIEYNQPLLDKVERGEVEAELIDRSVHRLLRTVLTFQHTPDDRSYDKSMVAAPSHIELAQEAAEKSMVLIKNTDMTLPLNAAALKSLLVVGHLACNDNLGDHGSSRIYTKDTVTPMEGIRKYLGKGVKLEYCDEKQTDKACAMAGDADAVIMIAGNSFNDEGEFVSPGGNLSMGEFVSRGYALQGQKFKSRLTKMIFKNGSYTEVGENDGGGSGGDRRSLSLRPEEIATIKRLGKVSRRLIVVLVGGSMIMTGEWEDSADAVLYSWYAGMRGGDALANILFGAVSPSGKLPFVIPCDANHLHPFDSKADKAYYEYYHGYRRLDHEGHKPQHPFGYGLSYTEFQISNTEVLVQEDSVTVTASISNTGRCRGGEVLQVYFGVPGSSVERYVHKLCGFAKVYLEPGESRSVQIKVPFEELKYYDEKTGIWQLEHAAYRFFVGTCCSDEYLKTIDIEL